MSLAILSPHSNNSFSSTIWWRKPYFKDSLALNFFAVNIQYLEFCNPIALDNLNVPPAPGIIPILVSGRPIIAFSEATLISQDSDSSVPPPKQ